MNEQEFPPNSHEAKAEREKQEKEQEPRVSRVTSGGAVRRKPGLAKKFKSTFFGADGKSTLEYVIFDVLIPAAKDTIVDAVTHGTERLVHGDTRRRSSAPRSGGATGTVQTPYHRFSMGAQQAPAQRMSRRGRSTHDFDEIVLEKRAEAEEVLERLYDVLDRFGTVSVADLYALVGERSTHSDHKYGWDNLRGAGIARVRGGFLLDLPDPEPLGQ